MARLGARVGMVGAVGEDSFGAMLREGLVRDGIDVRSVRSCTEESTGVAVSTLDAAGENHIVVAPSANARLTAADVEEGLAQLTAVEPVQAVVLQLDFEKPVGPCPLFSSPGTLSAGTYCIPIPTPTPARRPGDSHRGIPFPTGGPLGGLKEHPWRHQALPPRRERRQRTPEARTVPSRCPVAVLTWLTLHAAEVLCRGAGTLSLRFTTATRSVWWKWRATRRSQVLIGFGASGTSRLRWALWKGDTLGNLVPVPVTDNGPYYGRIFISEPDPTYFLQTATTTGMIFDL